jgi:large subunit ribosomal protein L21
VSKEKILKEKQIAKKISSEKKLTENSDFAVIETGGKQYLVEEGTIISIEKIESEKNNVINFDKILLHSIKGNLSIGTPYIKNVIVSAEFLSTEKDDKIRVFKFKPKTGYKKTQGHRQQLTTIKITSLDKKVKKEEK